jgi:hypothetical protein
LRLAHRPDARSSRRLRTALSSAPGRLRTTSIFRAGRSRPGTPRAGASRPRPGPPHRRESRAREGRPARSLRRAGARAAPRCPAACARRADHRRCLRGAGAVLAGGCVRGVLSSVSHPRPASGTGVRPVNVQRYRVPRPACAVGSSRPACRHPPGRRATHRRTPHRADPPRARTTGGSGLGLGLTITYELITAQRGTSTVTSHPGAASRLTVTLPASKGGSQTHHELGSGCPVAPSTPAEPTPSSNRRSTTAGLPMLDVDAELAQIHDRRSAPSCRVGRKRQHEGHPVRLSERAAIA